MKIRSSGGDAALSAAWILALFASLAALFLGEVLGRSPCILCWYQRAFMFPLVAVLGIGLWCRDRRAGRYGIALAAPGAAIAAWHLALYFGLVPAPIRPCSVAGPSCTDADQLIFGAPIALLSLVTFSLIALFSTLSLKDPGE